jgi:DNA-directed RNA polymerase specialized sigma24 family protein
MLTRKCRVVLLMLRRDRYTYQEIATRMGISVSMVKKYLVRGLSVCQQRVSRDSLNTVESLQGAVRQDG